MVAVYLNRAGISAAHTALKVSNKVARLLEHTVLLLALSLIQELLRSAETDIWLPASESDQCSVTCYGCNRMRRAVGGYAVTRVAAWWRCTSIKRKHRRRIPLLR